jgi:hypothetical protein
LASNLNRLGVDDSVILRSIVVLLHALTAFSHLAMHWLVKTDQSALKLCCDLEQRNTNCVRGHL